MFNGDDSGILMRRENVLVPKLRGNGTQLHLMGINAPALDCDPWPSHAFGRSTAAALHKGACCRKKFKFKDGLLFCRFELFNYPEACLGNPNLIAYGLPFGGFIATGSWG